MTSLALVAVLVPGLSACGSSSGSGTSGSPSASTTAGAKQIAVTVKGGKVSGDTGTVDVRIGEQVALTVTSDVADEVHVHGVDIGKDVAAGGTVTIDFSQPAPGRFDVELESRKLTLLRLQVS